WACSRGARGRRTYGGRRRSRRDALRAAVESRPRSARGGASLRPSPALLHGRPRLVSQWSRPLCREGSCSLRRTLPIVVGRVAETLRARVHAPARGGLGIDAPHELFATEELHCALELAREPGCRVFLQLAHPLVEGERGGLHVTLELSRQHAFDALGLAALEVDERNLEATSR